MKTIDVKVIIYTLTDVNGNIRTSVVSDYSDNICFGGIANDGQYHQYDSYEGYHSYEWAVKLGMRVDCYEKVVTLTVAD
jgi:hypothetical protein